MNDTCSVKVLGTHFNVMAYPNERQKQIALLEGSVEVKAGGKTILVKPGNRG